MGTFFLIIYNNSLFAQDSLANTKKIISFEGQIYPSSNTDIYSPNFKFRLNLNNSSALRINVDVNREADYKEILELGGDGVGSVEKINSMYQFSLGYEKQKRLKKSLVYSGFEGVLGIGKNDEYGSRTDSISFVSALNYNYKRPVQNFGLRVFFGGEYYVKSNIYVGTEFGFLISKTTYKNGTYQVLNEASVTSADVTENIPKTSRSEMLFSGLGVIRVGFVFK
ncbi:MAG: hypothetical protein CL841_00350 [Crocinitomicaceae bacterium]|nr:hypothetical protein [Crocinitomicaceae bacterium]